MQSTAEVQSHNNTKIYEETLSPWREKPRDKLQIISLYQIEITTLIDTTWVKKNYIFLFIHYSLSHFVISLTLSIFLFSFACPHSSNSSRLQQSSFSLAGTSIFTGAPSEVHFFSPSSLAEWPLHLFLHLFLLFSLSLSSNQVTINASHLLWLCFNQNLFL